MKTTKHLQCLYTVTHSSPKLPQIMELRHIVLCTEFKRAPCAPYPLISCQAVLPCLPLRRHKSDNASASEGATPLRKKNQQKTRKKGHTSVTEFFLKRHCTFPIQGCCLVSSSQQWNKSWTYFPTHFSFFILQNLDRFCFSFWTGHLALYWLPLLLEKWLQQVTSEVGVFSKRILLAKAVLSQGWDILGWFCGSILCMWVMGSYSLLLALR